VTVKNVWIFGILKAMTLVIGGIKINPRPQMEKSMEGLLDNMKAQREEGKKIRELLTIISRGNMDIL
jgi:hypothetical protein